MTSPGEMPTQHEAARQRIRADWDAVATGWYTQREEQWKNSRPVSEWIVRYQEISRLEAEFGELPADPAEDVLEENWDG